MSLRETIQQSFNNFLSSLLGDTSSLNSFLRTCVTIDDTIRNQHATLEEDTLVAAHNFATDVKNIASDILDLHQTSEILFRDSLTDISRILEEQMGALAIDDEHVSTAVDKGRHPAYIRPSFEWLLSNLHNPYPSKAVKKDIASETKCTIKDIDAWFIDARKRMGWNQLRKSRFSNKQDKIIAAATHIFNPKPVSFTDDLDSSLDSEMDSNEIYRRDFIMMANKARSLYADRFPELVSSISFDHAAKCVLPIVSPVVMPKTGCVGVQSPKQHLHIFDHDAPPYPTPEPSPQNYLRDESSSPTLVRAAEKDQSNPRKRRLSICEGSSSDYSQDTGESSASCPKRCRFETRETEINAAASLPSPSSSIQSLEQTTEGDIFGPHNIITPVLDTTRKRKRRLSDGESQLYPKRPHNALCVPHLQTVSDPFPFSNLPLEDVCDEPLHQNPPHEHHLSDTIPLPANASSSDPFLGVDAHQYDISSYSPGIYLPEISTSLEFAHVPRAPILPDQKGSSDVEPLSFVDAFGDAELNFIEAASDLQFDLSSSYKLDFQLDQLDASNNFSLFPRAELLSLVPGYIPFSSTTLGHDYNSPDYVDSAPTFQFKTSILGNSNQTISRDLSSGEQEVKRARARAIREELALYEAEGL